MKKIVLVNYSNNKNKIDIPHDRNVYMTKFPETPNDSGMIDFYTPIIKTIKESDVVNIVNYDSTGRGPILIDYASLIESNNIISRINGHNSRINLNIRNVPEIKEYHDYKKNKNEKIHFDGISFFYSKTSKLVMPEIEAVKKGFQMGYNSKVNILGFVGDDQEANDFIRFLENGKDESNWVTRKAGEIEISFR